MSVHFQTILTKLPFGPISAFADEISGDFDEQLAELNLYGVTGLDLRTALGKNVMTLSDEELDTLVQKASSAGIHFQCVGSPINKVVAAETQATDELAKLVRALEIAKRIGTDKIRLFSPETDDASLAYDWMAPMAELAQKEGVILLHENDARYYGAYPDKAKILFDKLGGPHFLAAFDFANTVHIGFRPMKDWFPWLLPHLHTIHIKDAIEAEHRVVPAGSGDGQMLETFQWLLTQGWSGPLTLEPHLQLAAANHGFSGKDHFKTAVEALYRLLEQLGDQKK